MSDLLLKWRDYEAITNTPGRAGIVSITDEHGKLAGFSVTDHET